MADENRMKLRGNKTTGIDFSSGTLTNAFKFATSGNSVTIGSTMTISPETTAESGYITIDVAGTAYQIPIYAA